MSEKKDFAQGLHLTFWMHQTHFGMGITVPNRAGKYWKGLRTIFKQDELFDDFTNRILELRRKVPHLYIEFLQRHYKGMTDAIVDGIVEVDVDTIFGNSKYHIKPNSLWYNVIRGLVQKKRYYNGQLMIRARFFYKDHPEIKTDKFKDKLITAAVNFKDIYDYLQMS